MSGIKISNLPASTTPLSGSEIVPLVQGGVTKNATVMQIGTVTATGSTTARTLPARFADMVNVKDFGAVGDGVADDTAAIQAAITARGAAGGGTVYFPPGQYKVLSTLLVANANVYLVGSGATSTTIFSTFGNDDVIRFYKFAAPGVSIDGHSSGGGNGFFYGGVRDMFITTTAASPSAGAAIKVDNVSVIDVASVNIKNTYNGCDIQNSGLTTWVDVHVANVVYDAFVVAGTPFIFFHRCTAYQSGPSYGNAGFHLKEATGVHITDCGSSTATGSLVIDPSTGKCVLNVFCLGCDFDNHQFVGISIDVSNGGSIYALQFTNGRVGFGAGPGIAISGGDNINFQNFQSVKNTREGLVITGGSHIYFNGQILGNSALGGTYNNVNISGGTDIYFDGGVVGKWRAEVCNAPYGIALQSSFAGTFTAIGVDLRNNLTAGYISAASSASIRIEFCLGYTSPLVSSVTVTASPMTYTAGSARETLFIRGGTVSDVKLTGTTVFSATGCTVPLQPGQACVITYSSAPTITKSVV